MDSGAGLNDPNPSEPVLSSPFTNEMGDSTSVQSVPTSPAPDNTSNSSTSPPPRQPDYDMTGQGSPHTVPLPSLSPWSSFPGTPLQLPSSPKCPHSSPLLLPATSPGNSRPSTAPSSPAPHPNDGPLPVENSNVEAEIVSPSPSFASFASDRDEYSSTGNGEGNDGSGNGRGTPSSELSDLERELLQVISPPRLRETRTPLPNLRGSCSVSPSASNRSSKARSSPPSYRVAKRGSRWSADDLAMLKHLREEKQLQWAEVSKLMPGRTALACNRYYNKTRLAADRSNGASSADGGAARDSSAAQKAKTSRWKLEEVRKMRRLKAGGVSWKDIAAQMPGRTIGACRRKKNITRMEIEAGHLSSTGGASDDEELADGDEEKQDAHEDAEESDDGEMSDVGTVAEERGVRSILEFETFSTSPILSSHDRPRVGAVEGSVLEEEGEREDGEVIERAITDADEVVESCMVDASDSSSGDESSSESDAEDESQVRRMHETFYKNR